ncbi:MAG: 4-vinyl reductase [Nitrososphaerota archaeon]|nr:4-vinyl reductase [Nitrososphaerota archaeon]
MVAGKFPKEVMIGRYDPTVSQVQIVAIVDTVGRSAELQVAAARLGVNFKHIDVHSVYGNGRAIFNAFAVLENTTLSAGKLETELRKTGYTINVNVVAGKAGALVDTLAFPVIWGGQRGIFMRQKAVLNMFSGIRSMLGKQGDMLLYNSGYAYGSDLSRFLTDVTGAEKMLETWVYALMLLSAGGWGVPDVEPGGTHITISECFECAGRKADQGICNFMRGMLTGFMEPTVGKLISIKEIACAAKGDNECKFLLDFGNPVSGQNQQ